MVRELSLDAADAFHKMEADNRPLQVCRDNFGSEDYKSTQPSDANSSRISRLFWLGARESAQAAKPRYLGIEDRRQRAAASMTWVVGPDLPCRPIFLLV